MIAFQEKNDGWQIDLTAYGMTFNEFSDYFTKLSQKNYSFPVSLDLDDELSENLDLVDLENISQYKVRIEGYLIVDNEFYETYLLIGEVVGATVEVSFFYGDELLAVFDKKLNQLPFPIVDTSSVGLDAYSELQLSKEWPTATHNFPKVYRPQLREDENYNDFLGFTNNRNGGAFLSNSLDATGDPRIARNYNVVCPMPYLLEILKVGFATEGKQIRGEFVEDAMVRKTVIVPQKFFEYYTDPIQRAYWKFNKTSTQTFTDDQILNTHTRTQTPSANGTYTLNMKVNIPKGILTYFKLTVTYGATEVYSAKAKSEAITIDKLLKINVANDDFSNIVVTLVTSNIQLGLSDYNSFTYDYKEGKLNVAPDVYSLTDIMPDMLFRTFYNAIKEFYNLDVNVVQNAVYFNYLDKSIQRLTYEDHTDYQIERPTRRLSENNLFKISYPDGEEILINKDGLTYSDTAYTDSETTKINLEVLPLKVSDNEEVTTGVHPDNDNELLIGIYDAGALVKAHAGRDYSLESMYEYNHQNFISFRANAEIVKEKFKAPVSAPFKLKRGVFKYNKLHLIKSLRKRRISEQFWEIETEMESF